MIFSINFRLGLYIYFDIGLLVGDKDIEVDEGIYYDNIESF